MQLTSDGGNLITAGSWNLIKTDSVGDTLWTRYTYISQDVKFYSNCVQQTSDDGYIMTGTTSDKLLWVVRTDDAGDTLWTQSYSDGEGYRIQPSQESGFIILQKEGPRLHKIGEDGALEWDTTFDLGLGLSIKPTNDGGYIITGTTADMAINSELLLFKCDPNGEILWTRFFEAGEGLQGADVEPIPEGGYIVTGRKYVDYMEDWDVLLIKTDANGVISIEEEPIADEPSFDLHSPIGREIVLLYNDMPQGFEARAFDPSGRLVDDMRAPRPSGSIT